MELLPLINTERPARPGAARSRAGAASATRGRIIRLGDLMQSWTPPNGCLVARARLLKGSSGLRITALSRKKNIIATLDPNVFAKASPSLYQLHLSDNPLVVQDGQPVLNHPRTLFLAKSGVSEVRAGAFCATSLNVLSLSNNPLRRFDVAAVDNVMHRGFIDVHDTPLACACAYDALYRWGVANNVSVAALCAGGSDCNIPKI
ncbi:Chondroadherin-like protein [Gryllus bimaculatus]|nr:Chondroadherin-like protein [Gryllus bimaculatus]